MRRRIPSSPRLRWRELGEADLDRFHALAVDEHVRRYLLDGRVVSREWSAEAVEKNGRLLGEHGLGLWLLSLAEPVSGAPIGFAGFWVFEELGPDLQLVYALRAEHTGSGLATEAARAAIAFARTHAGVEEILASVDAPNTASIRILEKLGFERYGETPGDFGAILLYRLGAAGSDRPRRN